MNQESQAVTHSPGGYTLNYTHLRSGRGNLATIFDMRSLMIHEWRIGETSFYNESKEKISIDNCLENFFHKLRLWPNFNDSTSMIL